MNRRLKMQRESAKAASRAAAALEAAQAAVDGIERAQAAATEKAAQAAAAALRAGAPLPLAGHGFPGQPEGALGRPGSRPCRALAAEANEAAAQVRALVDDILMLEAQDAADHVAALYEQAWQAEDRVAGLLCWDAKRQAVMKMICEKVVHGLAWQSQLASCCIRRPSSRADATFKSVAGRHR